VFKQLGFVVKQLDRFSSSSTSMCLTVDKTKMPSFEFNCFAHKLGITSSSAGNNRITTSKMYREEPPQQQQTVAVAAAIKPNPSNQLTSTTPTMITRSIKEQTEQDKEKD
jgi:hypothetical protein